MKKAIAAFLMTPVALILAAYGLSYLMQQRDLRAAADDIRLLEQQQPTVQGEGGDALFLIGYETSDAASRRQWLMQYGSNALMRNQDLPEHILSARLPETNNLPDCQPQPEESDTTAPTSCLNHVHSNLPEYRRAVNEHAKLLANTDALSQYDNLDVVIDDYIRDSLPPFVPIVRQRVAAAVDWAEGQHQAAIGRVCRNLQTGRTLMGSQNGLIGVMIGNAVVSRNTDLLADMLAQRPDFAGKLPESCTAALAAFPHGEPNICQAMKQEFGWQRSLSHNLAREIAADSLPDGSRWQQNLAESAIDKLLYSPEHTAVLSVAPMAYACSPAAIEAVAQDSKPIMPSPPPLEGLADYAATPACWKNLIGCILHSTAMPDYTRHAERLQDTAMQQRAFQAALSLYRLPAEQRRSRLNSVLAHHSSPSRTLSYDETSGKITFIRYNRHNNNPATDLTLALP